MTRTRAADEAWFLHQMELAYPEDWPERVARIGEPVWVPDTVLPARGPSRRA